MRFRIIFLIFGALVPSYLGADQDLLTIDAPVIDSATYQAGKDTLIIQLIEEPAPLAEPLKNQQEILPAPSEEDPLGVTFQISATSYAEKNTRFQIRLLGQGHAKDITGWSNLDWSLFTIRHELVSNGNRHSFLFFHTKVSSQSLQKMTEDPDPANHPLQAPSLLPPYESTGSRFLLTSPYSAETPHIETILDFLEALHALHDEEGSQLEEEKDLTIERNKERKRQILQGQKAPQTRILRIWRNNNLEKKGETE